MAARGRWAAKSARTLQIRRAIAQISRANRLNERDELYARLGSAISYAAYDGGYNADAAPKTRKERRLVRLNLQASQFAKSLGVGTGEELYKLRGQLSAEYRKPHPDYAQIQKLEGIFSRRYGVSNVDPRLDFWRAQVKARELEAQTFAAEKAGNSARLARLQEERNRNTRNFYFTNNIGDPPIYVSAPQEARLVVAIMPDGRIKTLDFNARQNRWEGNYDVPVGTREGSYQIQIVISLPDGTRRRYAMGFRVDTTAPQGRGEVHLSPEAPLNGVARGEMLRLEIEHGGDVARVSALLPWGEKVALLPSTGDSNRFFALVPRPASFAGRPVKVIYILVDRAHNLTTIEAESVSRPAP